MTTNKKEKQEKNSFDTNVEMFKDQGADSIFLSNFDGSMVCGEPCNSKTGDTWAMGLISSIEEALSCKYPLICSKNDKKLISLFNNVKKNINKNIKK